MNKNISTIDSNDLDLKQTFGFKILTFLLLLLSPITYSFYLVGAGLYFINPLNFSNIKKRLTRNQRYGIIAIFLTCVLAAGVGTGVYFVAIPTSSQKTQMSNIFVYDNKKKPSNIGPSLPSDLPYSRNDIVELLATLYDSTSQGYLKSFENNTNSLANNIIDNCLNGNVIVKIVKLFGKNKLKDIKKEIAEDVDPILDNSLNAFKKIIEEYVPMISHVFLETLESNQIYGNLLREEVIQALVDNILPKVNYQFNNLFVGNWPNYSSKDKDDPKKYAPKWALYFDSNIKPTLTYKVGPVTVIHNNITISKMMNYVWTDNGIPNQPNYVQANYNLSGLIGDSKNWMSTGEYLNGFTLNQFINYLLAPAVYNSDDPVFGAQTFLYKVYSLFQQWINMIILSTERLFRYVGEDTEIFSYHLFDYDKLNHYYSSYINDSDALLLKFVQHFQQRGQQIFGLKF